MNTVVIEQKQSGTGSIYDLASQHCDRVIKLNKNQNYIVITPSYYNMSASRHRDIETAIKKAKALARQGYQNVTILDGQGREYFYFILA